VAELVELGEPELAVAADGIAGREVGDQRLEALGDLVGELRSRRPPQRVDVGRRHPSHYPKKALACS
jgi:hypothetical protein